MSNNTTHQTMNQIRWYSPHEISETRMNLIIERKLDETMKVMRREPKHKNYKRKNK